MHKNPAQLFNDALLVVWEIWPMLSMMRFLHLIVFQEQATSEDGVASPAPPAPPAEPPTTWLCAAVYQS